MSIKAAKLMLDPGHDKARYNQSPVVPEYWEGAQMWKLYNFLRPALEAYGFIVGCTKSKCDQAVSVTSRGYKARGYNALISLHSNACGSASVNRPVGIYFTDDDCGPIDVESKALAKVLSGVVEEVMGLQPAEQYSKKSSRDRDGDGAVNDDYYGVLYAAHQVGVPAIILENSFHTNAEAAKWLMDDDNLKKLAQALADELAEYYGAVLEPAIQKRVFEVDIPVLRRGDKGTEVKGLQRHLRGYGYSLDVDGSFGPATEKALKAYQKANGLEQDGIRGPATFKSMNGL